MITRMNPKNALGIWIFARDNFLQGMEKTSLSFIGSKFSSIYKEEDFCALDKDTLKILLDSDMLSCGEEEVWEGLKVWLSRNNERDEKEITMIMESIRFGLLKDNFVYDKVCPVLKSLFPNFTNTISFS